MSIERKKGIAAIAIVLVLLIIDQVIKVWVKTHMTLGEAIEIAPWFKIEFIENRGMAWGMQLGPKLMLSVFRIIAVVILTWYICRQIRRNRSWGFLILLCLILAGAAGNIFDNVFYGQIFSASTPFDVAHRVPWGQGYNTGLLEGSVVDMFYFPLIHTTLPEWFPFGGGEEFVFFNAIFNFADACITVGVLGLLIFCTFDTSDGKEAKKNEEEAKEK